MTVILRDLGLQPYLLVWEAMKTFTQNRTPDSLDELWLVEHWPVYTQGQSGKDSSILTVGNIPLIRTDRGGQLTYHGPGQLIVYTLLDLKRLGTDTRAFVTALEESIIQYLLTFSLSAHRLSGAPGVYIAEKKIASLGLRVKKQGAYHGVALNVKLDMTPFQEIDPCGHAGLEVVQLSDFVPDIQMAIVKKGLIHHLGKTLRLSIHDQS